MIPIDDLLLLLPGGGILLHLLGVTPFVILLLVCHPLVVCLVLSLFALLVVLALVALALLIFSGFFTHFLKAAHEQRQGEKKAEWTQEASE